MASDSEGEYSARSYPFEGHYYLTIGVVMDYFGDSESAQYFGGTIDHVKFFSRGVTAEEADYLASTEACTIEAEEESEDDSDGISASIEDASPNGGDANGDGTPDSEQANVASFVNSQTDSYSVLDVPDGCTITSVQIVSETDASSTPDVEYGYPAGLMDFVLNCGTPGFTATITQIHYGVEGDFIVRKYAPSSGYFSVDSAVVSDETIGGLPAKVATYQVLDGSSLDLDGEVNGSIEDPAGLANLQPTLAETGQSMALNVLVGLSLAATSIALASKKLRVEKVLQTTG